MHLSSLLSETIKRGLLIFSERHRSQVSVAIFRSISPCISCLRPKNVLCAMRAHWLPPDANVLLCFGDTAHPIRACGAFYQVRTELDVGRDLDLHPVGPHRQGRYISRQIHRDSTCCRLEAEAGISTLHGHTRTTLLRPGGGRADAMTSEQSMMMVVLLRHVSSHWYDPGRRRQTLGP